MDKDGPISDDVPAGPTARDATRARDADLVARVRAGDPDAFGLLYDTWFERAFNVGLRIVRDHDTAAEVAQEAFLSAWRNLDGLADPASFGGWVLRIARNAALNRSARERRATAVDPEGMAVIERSGASPASAPSGFGASARLARIDDPAVAAADAEIVALVHEAAAALGERDAEVLDLQLRYQLAPAEVGEVMGLNRNAANQLCHRVRTRFAGAFGARLLWSDGRPRCADLRAVLEAAGVDRFGPEAVRLTGRHADGCPTCEDDRRTRVSPAALFGAVPLVPVLAATRGGVAHALAAAGVPMGGSTAAPGAAPGAAGGASSSPTAVRGSRARAVLVAAALVAATVLVVAFLFLRDGPRARARMVAGSGPTSQTASTAPGVGGTAAATAPGSSGDPVGRPGPPSTAPVVVAPTDPTLPDPTTPPTTTVPAPVVERFDLAPATAQPANWAVSSGPVLTWSVEGASDVTIWLWYDDGVNGDRRLRVEATGPSGSRSLCPGSVTGPDTCSAAPGRYSYELVATGSDGSMVTAPDRPGFTVQAPVVY